MIDVGDGLAVALKVESHNHPSAVEPFQGAATGVGGILRDIFAMGARPIAILDSLRFGELDDDRQRHLFARRRRRRRPLRQLRRRRQRRRRGRVRRRLRAQLAGQRDVRRPAAGRAADRGRRPPARATWSCCTGRRPAATASAAPACWPRRASTRAPADKRPSVQIGDPFTGKKLIECTLDAARPRPAGLAAGPGRGRARLVAQRDGGAAAASGIDVDLSAVPLREADMEPFEIMISESQERMAAVVEPARLERGAGASALAGTWTRP